MKKPILSIIIPTYNEEENLKKLLSYLLEFGEGSIEIILVDASSKDQTVSVSKGFGASVLESTKKGRAYQMNLGASIAKGDILYFLHADSIPPKTYYWDIVSAYNMGYCSGCFRLEYKEKHWWLNINSWYKSFSFRFLRFGDQSLFVDRSIFQTISGFDESRLIMEDQEIVYRITKHCRFIVLKGRILTSARKFIEHGVWRLQFVYAIVFIMVKLGFPQDKVVKVYKRLARL